MMAEKTERLDGLRTTADAAFSGLHADEAMRLRILRAAREGKAEQRLRWLSPAGLMPVACGLLILTVGGAAVLRGRQLTGANVPAGEVSTVSVNGLESEEGTLLLSDNGGQEGASVSSLQSIRAGEAKNEKAGARGAGISAVVSEGVENENTLFETYGREIPVICMNGAAYQLLKEPAELDSSLVGGAVGTVSLVTETPSLEVGSGETVSDCTENGANIYRVASLPETTAVAAEVDGKMRLFQRISYAGYGTENAALADLLGIRGQVSEISMSSGGTLSGDVAEQALELLLDSAVCIADDAEPGTETVTFVLADGLQLQMTADGGTLVGCGAWQCPEFLALLRQTSD